MRVLPGIVTGLLVLPYLVSPSRAAAQPTTLVYVDSAGAPLALQKKVDDRLRAVLAEKGVPVVADLAAGAPSDGRIAAAKRDLEKGIGAYRALSLDAAVAALTSAESGALGSPDSPLSPAVLSDARIYLGLCALANGENASADKIFRKVAAADPDRKLESKSFPPDTIAVFEKARKAVAAGSFCELALSSDSEGVSWTVDGRTAPGPTVRVAYGEHLVLASNESGTAADRVEVSSPRSQRAFNIVPDAARAVILLRAAAKRGDDAAMGRAADAIAGAAQAERVLLWDLRSGGGRVEAPLRFRDAVSGTFGRPAIADLGSTAAVDAPLRGAVAILLNPALVVERPPKPPKQPREGVAGWVWWVGGGLAVVAAGGAAAALSQPGGPGGAGGGDTVGVTVEKLSRP